MRGQTIRIWHFEGGFFKEAAAFRCVTPRTNVPEHTFSVKQSESDFSNGTHAHWLWLAVDYDCLPTLYKLNAREKQKLIIMV